jgi:hypothetical protein
VKRTSDLLVVLDASSIGPNTWRSSRILPILRRRSDVRSADRAPQGVVRVHVPVPSGESLPGDKFPASVLPKIGQHGLEDIALELLPISSHRCPIIFPKSVSAGHGNSPVRMS